MNAPNLVGPARLQQNKLVPLVLLGLDSRFHTAFWQLVRSLTEDPPREKMAGEEPNRPGLDDLVWPTALRQPAWADFRRFLEDQARTHANAAELLAAFHTLSAAECSDDDQKTFDALQQVGFAAAATAPEQLGELADALNQGSQGRFRIVLPGLGAAVNPGWMSTTPGVRSVNDISGWAVLDSESNVRHRAVVNGKAAA